MIHCRRAGNISPRNLCNCGLVYRLVIAALILCAAVGLIFATAPAQSTAAQSGDRDKATVYLYRVEEVDRFDRVRPKLYLDGEELARMPENRYFAVRLSPWHHTLSMFDNRARVYMQFEAGRSYYIKVSRKRKALDFKYEMTLVPEETATSQMRGLLPLEDKHLKKRAEIVKSQPR